MSKRSRENSGKGYLALAWSYYLLLMNWLILCRVFEIELFDGAASFY